MRASFVQDRVCWTFYLCDSGHLLQINKLFLTFTLLTFDIVNAFRGEHVEMRAKSRLCNFYISLSAHLLLNERKNSLTSIIASVSHFCSIFLYYYLYLSCPLVITSSCLWSVFVSLHLFYNLCLLINSLLIRNAVSCNTKFNFFEMIWFNF